MPPSLMLLLCIVLIYFLLKMDKREASEVSKATYIPLIWMCLAASRYVSQWLNPGAPTSLSAYEEGSAIDRTVFMLLILAGIIVLYKRKESLSTLLSSNLWVWLYFALGLISITWSDFPIVALKRLIRGIGNPIMASIILTEPRPYEALASVLRKFAFLMVPTSMILIMYFPQYGRAYHMGYPSITGVAAHKNMLGAICLVSALIFCWMLVFPSDRHVNSKRIARIVLYSTVSVMAVWLLYRADSATASFCFLLASCVILISAIPSFKQNPQNLFYATIGIIIIAFGLDLMFGIKDKIFILLGRDLTLTTRVPMWKDLISTVKNPMFGFGYDSFWMGDRQRIINGIWGIGNAHNGYLDMYLNLGLMGLFSILCWIVSGAIKIKRHLQIDYPNGVLRLVMLIVVVFYNYTESTFFGVSMIWMIMFLGIMDPPRFHQDRRNQF